MTIANHLTVHYLDLFRHWWATIFQPFNWGSNFSAWIICGALAALGTYLLWPKIRKAVDSWLHGHLTAHAENLVADLKAHHEAVAAELHGKLDQLLHVANAAGPSAQTTTTNKETPTMDIATEATDAVATVVDDIATRFRHHPPSTEAVAQVHATVRTLLEDTARQLVTLVPGGREAALVLTKLEEVGFWAHAAIARNQAAPTAPPAADVPAPQAPAEPVPAPATEPAATPAPVVASDVPAPQAPPEPAPPATEPPGGISVAPDPVPGVAPA